MRKGELGDDTFTVLSRRFFLDSALFLARVSRGYENGEA